MAPMGPKGAEGALPPPGGPKGPLGPLALGPPLGGLGDPSLGSQALGPTPGARPGLLGITETALRENCAASKLRCGETALRANGSAGKRGA